MPSAACLDWICQAWHDPGMPTTSPEPTPDTARSHAVTQQRIAPGDHTPEPAPPSRPFVVHFRRELGGPEHTGTAHATRREAEAVRDMLLEQHRKADKPCWAWVEDARGHRPWSWCDHIATAYLMAPEGSREEAMAEKLLAVACSRVGLDAQDVVDHVAARGVGQLDDDELQRGGS